MSEQQYEVGQEVLLRATITALPSGNTGVAASTWVAQDVWDVAVPCKAADFEPVPDPLDEAIVEAVADEDGLLALQSIAADFRNRLHMSDGVLDELIFAVQAKLDSQRPKTAAEVVQHAIEAFDGPLTPADTPYLVENIVRKLTNVGLLKEEPEK